MRRYVPLVLTVCCLFSGGCLSMARKVEQAARGRDRNERELARQRAGPALDAVDISSVAAHPRLFVGEKWPAATDDVSRGWQARLVKRADDTLDKPPIPFEPKKMLAGSREALRRISLLAGVYRFTGDKKYANAVRRELANVCSFKHWQPDAFLATAEMMTAVSIGYDWCHDALPVPERKAVVTALIRNGLQPAVEAYDHAEKTWPSMRNNWNLVCNGGTIVAALAVAEEEPKLAQEAMDGATKSIRFGLALYDDNGGTVEGPMYHSYATRYLTFAAAAIATATPDQRDALTLLHIPLPHSAKSRDDVTPQNWTSAGHYRLAMTGPSGAVANFGDCNATLGNTAWMFWLARQTAVLGKLPDHQLADFQTAVDWTDPSAFDLLWYLPPDNRRDRFGDRAVQSPPRPIHSADGPLVFDAAVVLRENFTDANAAFVAIRTGSTAASHSHLDLGNFVYDVLGERFACDLGADSYDLPGYLHDRRPDYLRTSTPGHNCLTFGESSQPLAAEVTVRPSKKSDGQSVRVDLTDAYPTADAAERSFRLNGRDLTVTDTLKLRNRTTVIWHLHTPAKVTLTKAGAVLDNNGRRVELRVLSPEGARFTTEPDDAPPPQLPVEGITHLRLKVLVKGETEIRVEFHPVGN